MAWRDQQSFARFAADEVSAPSSELSRTYRRKPAVSPPLVKPTTGI